MWSGGIAKDFVILTTRFTNEFRKTLYQADLSKIAEQIKDEAEYGSNRKKFTFGTLLFLIILDQCGFEIRKDLFAFDSQQKLPCDSDIIDVIYE